MNEQHQDIRSIICVPDCVLGVGYLYHEGRCMTDSEMLNEADRILCEARRAIGKILVERERGMGYFHAEVDWLVKERDNINKLIKAIRARGEAPTAYESSVGHMFGDKR